jgi:SAM-dependent methyltransferase
MPDANTAFTGNVPENYDRYFGPALFEPYAADLAARLKLKPGLRVLELACGTGIVTRRLLARLPDDGRLLATDLNAPMIEYARGKIPADLRLSWQAADAQALPFPDASFDAVVCQFGVMFFPDKVAALREARRVMAPGAQLLFSSWFGLKETPCAEAASELLARRFPDNPPRFLEVPHGYGDPARIRADFAAGGFPGATLDDVAFELQCPTADDYATGLVTGTPLSGILQERGVDKEALRKEIAAALAPRFGAKPFKSPMRAWVIEAAKKHETIKLPRVNK